MKENIQHLIATINNLQKINDLIRLTQIELTLLRLEYALKDLQKERSERDGK